MGGEEKAHRGEKDWHIVTGKILPRMAKCPPCFKVLYIFNDPNIVQHLRWLKYNLFNSFDSKHQIKHFLLFWELYKEESFLLLTVAVFRLGLYPPATVFPLLVAN